MTATMNETFFLLSSFLYYDAILYKKKRGCKKKFNCTNINPCYVENNGKID